MIEILTDIQAKFLQKYDPDLYEEWKGREQWVNQIYEWLQNGQLTFINERKQEGFVHPDPRGKSNYQFTYFDQYGPIGHFNEDTLEALAKHILEYHFKPLDPEDLVILT